MKIVLLTYSLIMCGYAYSDELTPAQKEYYSKLSNDGRVYFDSCIKRFAFFDCMDRVRTYSNNALVNSSEPWTSCPQVAPATYRSQKTSAGDIAVGTALGIGATKLLFSK